MSSFLEGKSEEEQKGVVKGVIRSSYKHLERDVYSPVYGHEGVGVEYEDFADVAVSYNYLNDASAFVKNNLNSMILELARSDEGMECLKGAKIEPIGWKVEGKETLTLPISVESNSAIGFSGIDDVVESGIGNKDALSKISNALKLRILKIVTLEALFLTCKDYRAGEELFGYIMQVKGYKELLHPGVFNSWMVSSDSVEERMRILGYMKELKVKPNMKTAHYLLSEIPDADKYKDLYGRLIEISEIRPVLVSQDFFLSSLDKSRAFEQGLFLYTLIKDHKLKVSEGVLVKWLGLCSGFREALRILHTSAAEFEGMRFVPSTIWKKMLEFANESSKTELGDIKLNGEKAPLAVDDFIGVVSLIYSHNVPVRAHLLEDLDLDPEMAVKIKDRIGFMVKDGEMNDLHDRYVNSGRTMSMPGKMNKQFFEIYGYVSRRAVLAEDYEYLLECGNVDDFMAMIERLYDERGGGDDDVRKLISKLDLSVTMCSSLKKRLEDFFQSRGIDIVEFSYARSTGIEILSGEWCVDLYEYVKRYAEFDKVKDYIGFIEFMWEEGVSPNDKFISLLDDSGVDFVSLKREMEGVFSGLNGRPDIMKAYEMENGTPVDALTGKLLDEETQLRIKNGRDAVAFTLPDWDVQEVEDDENGVVGDRTLGLSWVLLYGHVVDKVREKYEDKHGKESSNKSGTVDDFVSLLGGWLTDLKMGGKKIDYLEIFQSRFKFGGREILRAVERCKELVTAKGYEFDLSNSELDENFVEFWRLLVEEAQVSKDRVGRKKKKRKGAKSGK